MSAAAAVIVAGEDDEEEELTSSEEEPEVRKTGSSTDAAPSSPASSAAPQSHPDVTKLAERDLILGALRDSQEIEEARLTQLRAEHAESVAKRVAEEGPESVGQQQVAGSKGDESRGLGGFGSFMSRVKQVVSVGPAAATTLDGESRNDKAERKADDKRPGSFLSSLASLEMFGSSSSAKVSVEHNAEDELERRLEVKNKNLREAFGTHMAMFYVRANGAMEAVQSGTALCLNQAQEITADLSVADENLKSIDARLAEIDQLARLIIAPTETSA